MKIEGSVALVTGAASGLGRATTEGLLAAGARVVLIDLPSSDGAAVAESLGEAATFAPADVADVDAVGQAVATAVAQGPLRIAVNCAGIVTPGKVLGRSGPLDLNTFAKVIQVNLVGTFNVLRLAAAAMA